MAMYINVNLRCQERTHIKQTMICLVAAAEQSLTELVWACP